jgi:hypothetical protein
VASVFAVVSKKVFETEARVAKKVLGLGGVWPTAKYASTHASLKPLGDGGHLFLVTVRPPDEALWLIAVLRDVKATKDGWTAAANTTPAIDITPLKSKIKFATGTGITAAKGKLGMSLQTPRTLTDDDVKLLLAAAGGTVPAAPSPPPGKLYHLNAHESGPLPCLCQKCLPKAPERVVVAGEAFVRREATAKGRVVYYWLPEASIPSEKAVRIAVERRMQFKLPAVVDHSAGGGKKKRRGGDDDDEDDDE